MNIRIMTPDDYDAVYRLWISTPGMGLNATDDSKEGILKYLNRNPTTCFVAEEGQELLGVILSGHDGRRGYIYHLAVKVAHRHKGTGSALLTRALDALKAEGIAKVALVVFSNNETGNRFWEKQGFTVRDDLQYRNKAILELTRIDT